MYTFKLKPACGEPDLSLSGLDPVPLSKIGTRLLACLGSKGKNRSPLACLRNAGSYSARSCCIPTPGWQNFVHTKFGNARIPDSGIGTPCTGSENSLCRTRKFSTASRKNVYGLFHIYENSCMQDPGIRV